MDNFLLVFFSFLNMTGVNWGDRGEGVEGFNCNFLCKGGEMDAHARISKKKKNNNKK